MLTADTAADVVERIVNRLKPLKEYGDKKTPLQKLEYLIASKLSELETRNPQALRDAAMKVGLSQEWRSDNKYSEELARALLSPNFAQIAEPVLVLPPHFPHHRTALDL